MSSSISVFLSAKLSYRLDFVYRPCMIFSKRKNLINGSKQFNAFAFNLTAKIVYMKRRTQGGGAIVPPCINEIFSPVHRSSCSYDLTAEL